MSVDIKKLINPKRKLEITIWDPVHEEDPGTTFESTIHSVADNRFFVPVTETTFKKVLPHIQRNVLAGAVIYSEPNPVMFYPLIESAQKTGHQGIWFTVPEDVSPEVIHRRAFIRVDMELLILIERQVGANLDDWVTLRARTVDVGGGGVRLETSVLLPKESNLIVHLRFSEDQPLMKINAKVVFSKDNGALYTPAYRYTAACQFVDTPDQYQMNIVGECFRRELESQRNKAGKDLI